ncbi:hypothetical protein TNCV_4141661 [Trichonephila clavipes]|nr:hypothetical protein TNCV_4141661 [Trichonephila clavipes]
MQMQDDNTTKKVELFTPTGTRRRGREQNPIELSPFNLRLTVKQPDDYWVVILYHDQLTRTTSELVFPSPIPRRWANNEPPFIYTAGLQLLLDNASGEPVTLTIPSPS